MNTDRWQIVSYHQIVLVPYMSACQNVFALQNIQRLESGAIGTGQAEITDNELIIAIDKDILLRSNHDGYSVGHGHIEEHWPPVVTYSTTVARGMVVATCRPFWLIVFDVDEACH